MSPSDTEAQRKMMCVALAMKRGEMKKTNTAAGKAADSMTEEQLVEMCGSKPKKE